MSTRTYEDFPEAAEIANEIVIPRWHPNLENIAIRYLVTGEMKARGHLCYAKVQKASPLLEYLGKAKVFMIVNGVAWGTMDDASRIALVDHELCHVRPKTDFDEEGDEVLTGEVQIVGHDLEEFKAVVERHGEWDASVHLFSQALAAGRLEQAKRAAQEVKSMLTDGEQEALQRAAERGDFDCPEKGDDA